MDFKPLNGPVAGALENESTAIDVRGSMADAFAFLRVSGDALANNNDWRIICASEDAWNAFLPSFAALRPLSSALTLSDVSPGRYCLPAQPLQAVFRGRDGLRSLDLNRLNLVACYQDEPASRLLDTLASLLNLTSLRFSNCKFPQNHFRTIRHFQRLLRLQLHGSLSTPSFLEELLGRAAPTLSHLVPVSTGEPAETHHLSLASLGAMRSLDELYLCNDFATIDYAFRFSSAPAKALILRPSRIEAIEALVKSVDRFLEDRGGSVHEEPFPRLGRLHIGLCGTRRLSEAHEAMLEVHSQDAGVLGRRGIEVIPVDEDIAAIDDRVFLTVD